jgi:hypothetical protein
MKKEEGKKRKERGTKDLFFWDECPISCFLRTHLINPNGTAGVRSTP